MCSISTTFIPTVPPAVTPTCTQQRKLTLRGVSSSASREMVCAFALRVTIWVVMKVTLRYGSRVLRALSKIKEESRFFLERWQIAPQRRVTFTTQVLLFLYFFWMEARMCHQLRCGWLQLELVERAVKVGPRRSVPAGGPARQGVVSGHHVVVRGRHQQNRLQVQRFARSGDANGVRHVGVVNFTWNTSETFF